MGRFRQQQNGALLKSLDASHNSHLQLAKVQSQNASTNVQPVIRYPQLVMPQQRRVLLPNIGHRLHVQQKVLSSIYFYDNLFMFGQTAKHRVQF